MLGPVKGHRPDITPAHIIALVIAGVPSLLVLFGVNLGVDQGAALDKLLILAGAIVAGDTGLRIGRNYADATRDAAALSAAAPSSPPAELPPPTEDEGGPEVEFVEPGDDAPLPVTPTDDLPSDEAEFAAPPPADADLTDEFPSAVQPSEDGAPTGEPL